MKASFVRNYDKALNGQVGEMMLNPREELKLQITQMNSLYKKISDLVKS